MNKWENDKEYQDKKINYLIGRKNFMNNMKAKRQDISDIIIMVIEFILVFLATKYLPAKMPYIILDVLLYIVVIGDVALNVSKKKKVISNRNIINILMSVMELLIVALIIILVPDEPYGVVKWTMAVMIMGCAGSKKLFAKGL